MSPRPGAAVSRGGKGRPLKRKVNLLMREGVEHVDWKDTALLRKFLSDRGKIRARRVTGLDADQQRAVARAIKNAREMALLPYPGNTPR